MHALKNLKKAYANFANWRQLKSALIGAICVNVFCLLIGCASKPSMTVTVPTPAMEYSQPQFHTTFEPPLPFSQVSSPVGAPIQPSGNVTLSWDYPASELGTNLVFKLYTSPDISVPLTNWAVLTNIAGTNLSARIQITPGKQFFALTASNFWGESDFSEVALTPALPRSDMNLRITRGTP